jgi:hypothetical protein
MYEIDVARRLVLTRGWGELSDEDLRLFQAYSEAEGQMVEVFRNMSEAEAWLGIRAEA